MLLALAIVIALLGIGNTLALSIFERTRELGVMRAVGMTRRQLRTTIRLESVIIASQGTLLGLLVGVFFGWALVLAQKNQGITEFSVPYLTLIIVILLAALAGVAAAILPSRRASWRRRGAVAPSGQVHDGRGAELLPGYRPGPARGPAVRRRGPRHGKGRRGQEPQEVGKLLRLPGRLRPATTGRRDDAPGPDHPS